MALDRSQQMSRIRGKNTKPEMVLRRALWSAGLRYRVHWRTPAGRPDVVFPGPRVAVFIDGCFWHGCPDHYVRPGTREDLWSSKLRENVDRDRRQTRELEEAGWTVVRVWEHEVFERTAEVVDRVRHAVSGAVSVGEPDWRVVRVIEVDAETRTETRYLERLRDSERTRQTTGRRITAKWRRPRSSGKGYS